MVRSTDVTQLSEGLSSYWEMVGDCPHSMSPWMLGAHVMAEIDRHHPTSVSFEQPAYRAGSCGDIEDEAVRCQLVSHQP